MINESLHNFIERFTPSELGWVVQDRDKMQCASFLVDKKNELRIMQVHKHNAMSTGLDIPGLNELIVALDNFNEKSVCVVNVRSQGYQLKFYSDINKEILLGLVILKLRKKTNEEMQFARDVLGITSSVPSIDAD
ncbi:hypothetical protein [Pseudescherichia sp.]|uniref:hypothetical protein n=1 Tax=Pseudescherichia sp. TaxID=2055881 RepID=UPI00289F2A19|nr:hypothetical protein [Pseudescherichia sp.]